MTTVHGTGSGSDDFWHAAARAVEQHGATALAAVSAAGAAAAAIFTWRQAAAARKQLALSERIRRESSEPYVIVDITPQAGATSLLLFSIQNAGPTLARDVRLSITPPLQGGDDAFDKQLAVVVTRTIPFIPPGRRLEWAFAIGGRLFEDESLPREYTVIVNASGPAGPVEPLKYVINLDAIRGLLLDHSSVETYLKKLVENTKGLNSVTGELGVIAEALSARTQADLQQSPSLSVETPDPAREEAMLRLAEASTNLPVGSSEQSAAISVEEPQRQTPVPKPRSRGAKKAQGKKEVP